MDREYRKLQKQILWVLGFSYGIAGIAVILACLGVIK